MILRKAADYKTSPPNVEKGQAELAADPPSLNMGSHIQLRGSQIKLNATFLSPEYYHVVTIPPGARSIRIYETNISTSYISVRNSLKKYYLNGHWSVDWPGRYKFSGTAFNYRRSYKEPESLTSSGPTNETLIVEVETSFWFWGWIWWPGAFVSFSLWSELDVELQRSETGQSIQQAQGGSRLMLLPSLAQCLNVYMYLPVLPSLGLYQQILWVIAALF